MESQIWTNTSLFAWRNSIPFFRLKYKGYFGSFCAHDYPKESRIQNVIQKRVFISSEFSNFSTKLIQFQDLKLMFFQKTLGCVQSMSQEWSASWCWFFTSITYLDIVNSLEQ